MKRIKLLWRILKTTGVDKIILVFIALVLLSGAIFALTESGVNGYGEGLWYSFAVFTTIGFGDVVAVTVIGRTLTVILGIYGIFVAALVPGVLVNYFTEISRIKANNSVSAFLDKLECLPDLTPDELACLSQTIKDKRFKL